MYFYKCFHFCSLTSDHFIQLPFTECLLHIDYCKKHFRNRISFHYNTTMKEGTITEYYRLDVFTTEIVDLFIVPALVWSLINYLAFPKAWSLRSSVGAFWGMWEENHLCGLEMAVFSLCLHNAFPLSMSLSTFLKFVFRSLFIIDKGHPKYFVLT